MEISVQITKTFDICPDEVLKFRAQCLQYVQEHYEECAIKSLDDIPGEAIESVVTDALPSIIESKDVGYDDGGVIIDDCFSSINFDFYEDTASDLVRECVEYILQDIDYEPKFKQLLELSGNLKTGMNGDRDTFFNNGGFKLISQFCELTVIFQSATQYKDWRVIYYDNDSNQWSKKGHGWNELIDFLCTECEDTSFMNMSKEDIQKCKLWKEVK